MIILNEIKKLPFNIFVFVCDKRKISPNAGLRFKKTFYKFLNEFIYSDLQLSFRNLTIKADESGTSEFSKEFAAYVKKKTAQLSLFDEFNFNFSDSKHNAIVQIADYVSGCLAYNYDKTCIDKADSHYYKSLLSDRDFNH